MGHDHDDHGHGHDDHGHGHDDHGHGHGHGPQYVPYKGQFEKKSAPPIPPMGSAAYVESHPEIDEKAMAETAPRSMSSRLLGILHLSFASDANFGLGQTHNLANNDDVIPLWKRMLHGAFLPKPRTYTSEYLRPNPCPEVHWWNSWRWPRFKYVNPKVPPPEDGVFNDYYHYIAYKNWFERERRVYYMTMQIAHEQVLRCLVKEGQYNSFKNCRHLVNKEFALTREEEHNQMLLHMATTGQNAIRETPYPSNFVDEKRKIYDNWLFRTRLRKPGDVM